MNTEGRKSQQQNDKESKHKQHNNLKTPTKMLNRPTSIKDVFWIWRSTREHTNTHTRTHTEWSCAAVVEWVWSELTRRSENTATWAALHFNSAFTLRVCVRDQTFSHTHEHLMPNSHSLAAWEMSTRPSITCTKTQFGIRRCTNISMERETHRKRGQALLSGTRETTELGNQDVWLSLETSDHAWIPWLLSHSQTKGLTEGKNSGKDNKNQFV